MTPRPGRAGGRERGCAVLLLTGWLAWVLVDLGRLGVFSGERELGDAVFDMPSVGWPLLLLVGLVPLVGRIWLESRRKKAFPGEPWMWERRWDRRGARPLEWRRLLQPLAIGVPVTVIAPLLAVIARVVVRSDFLLLALTPFYLFVLGFWAWWGFRLARLLRFRRPYFRYDRFPFFLGERVEGALEGVELLEGCARVSATLRCVREEWRGSGRSRTRSRETLREVTQEIGPAGWVRRLVGPSAGSPGPGATRLVVPLRFELGAGDPGTKLAAEPAYLWELETRAERPGFDFQATFLLPVYAAPSPAAGGGAPAGTERAGSDFTPP